MGNATTTAHRANMEAEQAILVGQTKKKRPPLNNQTVKAIELIQQTGCEPKAAYFLATGRIPSQRSEYRLQEKVAKWSLQTPQMQKLATNAVKETLQMKPLKAKDKEGNDVVISYPSHTNRIAAAAMVQDRVDPAVRRQENMNINVDLHPVDLDKYLG